MSAHVVLLAILFFAANPAVAEETLRWLSDHKPTPQAVAILDALNRAEDYGLEPQDYETGLSASQLKLVMNGQGSDTLDSRFDHALTRSTSRFVRHLQRGRVSAAAAGFDLPAVETNVGSPDPASQIAVANDVDAMLTSLEPRPAPYRLLKQALLRYRELARDPTMHALPPIGSTSLELGAEYAGVPQLKHLLNLFGDLPADGASSAPGSTRIDASLTEAVRRFQQRHGIAADGVIGKRTFAALSVPIQQRVRQIELSLERWRWLAAANRRPDIIVNIPQFMLYALPRPTRPNEQLLEIPVIVGRPHDRTPVFMAAIEQVIFQPYWDVPASIMRKELLPKLRKDLSYLERHHFEIVRGGGDDARVLEPNSTAIEALASGTARLRQRPGSDNALGPVKFVLPNPYQVRLHGTSEPRLFDESRRAFSHGCIRVSDPAALAEYVLVNAAGNWNTAAVDAALCGTQTLRVSLTKPVQVVVFYATAAATQSRGVLFSVDVYGHDARLEKLLSQSSSS